MRPPSPESPEARRDRGDTPQAERRFRRFRPGGYVFEVGKRVGIGVYSDGFIHAGNLAYMSLVTLFPFFIVAAAIAQLVGRTTGGIQTVNAFLRTVPPGVADVIAGPINDVLGARSGALLWFGGLVGLWTTASFIETIRDILHRAYGVGYSHPFWRNRLSSTGLIIASVFLVLLSFSLQVLLTAAEQFIWRLLPFARDAASIVSLTRVVPAFALFGAMYLLFYSLTPGRYRRSDSPKWPGALFTTLWWLATTFALPRALALLGGYDLTYGSLAGVMIALIFFFIIGLGVVIGAQLNAALAEVPPEELDDLGKPTE